MVLKTRETAPEDFDSEDEEPVVAGWPRWAQRSKSAALDIEHGPGGEPRFFLARSGVRYKVALFTDYYPPHIGGGVEQVVANLASGLSQRGHDVRVFTLRTCGGDAFEQQPDGVRVYRANALQLTRHIGMQTSIAPELHKLASKVLSREPADLLHAHNRFFFSSLVAARLSEKLHTPLVTTLHVGSLADLPLAM